MPTISPDHFLFATLPEEEGHCPDCGVSARYVCECEEYFTDPDDKDFYND